MKTTIRNIRNNAKTRKTFSGIIHVCAHRVEFWYDLEGLELTEEQEGLLTEGAESRAKDCVIQGYSSGDLHTTIDNQDTELSGWWNINRGGE